MKKVDNMIDFEVMLQIVLSFVACQVIYLPKSSIFHTRCGKHSFQHRFTKKTMFLKVSVPKEAIKTRACVLDFSIFYSLWSVSSKRRPFKQLFEMTVIYHEKGVGAL